MEAIPNIDIYNSRMRAAMYDELWFIDHPILNDVKQVYDYGCADGALLECVHFFKPEWEMYGYDVSEEMIDKANENFPFAHYISTPMAQVKDNTLLVASSVFHEIHNYSEDIGCDYRNIFECGAKYTAIRDMFYSEESVHPSDMVEAAKVFQLTDEYQLDSFQLKYGSINQNKNLLHFLLKYRYKENWSREVEEDYLPHSVEEFIGKIPENYGVVYFEHYTLPFLKNQVKKDFGIDLKDKTHAKILLKRVV